MQRLHNINKWFHVPDGKAVNFGNPEPRSVRLDVNAAGTAHLDYVDGNGEVTFLALVTGRDVIEFKSHGEFAVQVSGADCYLYTIDGEDISFSIPDAVKLTKLAERRTRNPEIEYMQYMMNANMERRLNAMRGEMERVLHSAVEAAKATSDKPPSPTAGDSVPAKPAPDKSSDAGGVDKPADDGTGKSAG